MSADESLTSTEPTRLRYAFAHMTARRESVRHVMLPTSV